MESKEILLALPSKRFPLWFTDNFRSYFENVFITTYQNVNVRILGFKKNPYFTLWFVAFKIMFPEML